ncbi:hypothetical protein [Clostridium sporogenes]|nr:hypothetical protein [Clostridium sporogenes]
MHVLIVEESISFTEPNFSILLFAGIEIKDLIKILLITGSNTV